MIRDLLGLDPVSLTIKRGRLRWFGHVERKDDAELAPAMYEDGA